MICSQIDLTLFVLKALQIAQLIRDYTSALAKQRGQGRRKSVEFDLSPKAKINQAQNRINSNANQTIPTNQLNQNANETPQPVPRSSLIQQQRQVHPMQNKIMNPQILEQQNYYSNGGGNSQMTMQNAFYLQKQQQQKNGNISSQSSTQQFHPTHRRSRPLSILYKASPVITTRPEHV